MTVTRPTVLIVLALAAAGAGAAEPLPIRPDEAALACQARAMHAIGAEGGAAAHPVRRFATEAMPRHMWKVTGLLEARFAAGPREVEVSCDVSSLGVEVFTMALGPARP